MTRPFVALHRVADALAGRKDTACRLPAEEMEVIMRLLREEIPPEELEELRKDPVSPKSMARAREVMARVEERLRKSTAS